MSHYAISTGVLDNDAKGTTGRGTVHWLTITQGAEVVEHHEYGLLEELAGTFNPESIKAKYLESNKGFDAKEKQQASIEKQAEKTRRLADAKDDPDLITLIDEIIADSPKPVAEYLAGKDKAIHAVVGKVIGRMKEKHSAPDTLAIAALVKRQVTKLNKEPS